MDSPMVPMWFSPVEINEETCNGCNICVDVCMSDVLQPNPEQGKPPIVMYPDECWYGGCCVEECPRYERGAIKLIIPLSEKVSVLRG